MNSAYVLATVVQALPAVDLSTTSITVLGIGAIMCLIVLSGFFSSSEIAMFSLADHRIDAMVEEGQRGATIVKALKEDPHRLLVTILVGNNLVNITMSSISTTIVAFYLEPGTAVLVSSFGITSLVLLFGESAPKSYAVENTERHARRVAPPLSIAGKLLWPLITLFYYLTYLINRITGGRSTIGSTYVTRSEIKDMIQSGERAGVLEEEEHQMLQRIFRFNNTIAKEVMTPRLDMTAVAVEDGVSQALDTCVQSGHARIPVYEGSLDNVIGVVHIRDLVRDGHYGENDVALRDVMHPTLHVPESKNVDELLEEMREERVHMAVVIDEFGTTEGLITMEDMVEEIVGEILEGEEDEPIERVDERTVVVQGEVNIEEVNEALDVDIPEGEEFETIAGFVFNRAGRLVEAGEEITFEDVTIRVERVENTRILEARVEKRETEEGEEGDSLLEGVGDDAE